MFPWVSDYEHIAHVVRSEFEKEHPGVELVVSEQNEDYDDFDSRSADKRDITLLEFLQTCSGNDRMP